MDKDKISISPSDASLPSIEDEIVNDLEENDALKSFLDRDVSVEDTKEDTKKSKNKLSKNALWLIVAAVAVVLVFGLVILFNVIPDRFDPSEVDNGTPLNLSVDENGEHQAQLILNDKGELENNSYGTLISYTPSDIQKIDIEIENDSYTILAETPTEVNEETGEKTKGATVYTLVGYEDNNLQTGVPDAIADIVAALEFTSVADITGVNASDFGFDKPRAVIKTTYNDDTTSTIIVGADAPSALGAYIMFGSSKTIYVVSADTVSPLLISAIDLVSLTINEAAADTTKAEFESIVLDGTAFDQSIEIRPNEDSAIDSSYVMISPDKMYVSETEAAAITGAIRGLYADKVICVNPSSKQLKKYSLVDPYAQLTAVYPDTTITLKASKPKDGNVYLLSDSDIIYQIAVDSVAWVTTSYQKLIPEIVIDPNFASVAQIEVTNSSGTYLFDVTTTTETVTDETGTETYQDTTTAVYNGETLDENNFYVFYQNIANMQNAGVATDKESGKAVLTIKLTYNTGRESDVVKVYATNTSKYIATLNGEVQCLVYKSYCTKFSQSISDLINGNTVSSF